MQLEDPRIRYRQLQNECASMESIPLQTSSQVKSLDFHLYLFLVYSFLFYFAKIKRVDQKNSVNGKINVLEHLNRIAHDPFKKF